MTRAVWLMRALLGALLAFMSEVILWTSPDTRPAFDWFVTALGYLALATLLLDLAARYRLRDTFGLLALAGVYGLLNAALLNPTSAFIDFPRTLFTRAMGGHTLMGLLALALWLRLTGASWNRRTFIPAGVVALVLGVVWGYWAHYSPTEFLIGDVRAPATGLITILIVYAISALILILLLYQLRRLSLTQSMDSNSDNNQPPFSTPTTERGSWGEISFRLDRLSAGFVFVVFAALLGSHLVAADLDTTQITIVIMFSLFCVGIIWFQKRQKGASLLDNRLQANSTSPLDFYSVALLVIVLIAGLVGYHLPRPTADQADPLAIIGSVLTAYGLVWLPLVTFVLGAREFTKQSRAMRL